MSTDIQVMAHLPCKVGFLFFFNYKNTIILRIRLVLAETRVIWYIEKGRDLTQPYDKNTYTNKKCNKIKRQHKTLPKEKLDYTTIAEKLRMVGWINYNHPYCVDNLVYALKGFVWFSVCICWQVCPGLIRRWTNDILYIKLSVPLDRIWTQQRIN